MITNRSSIFLMGRSIFLRTDEKKERFLVHKEDQKEFELKPFIDADDVDDIKRVTKNCLIVKVW